MTWAHRADPQLQPARQHDRPEAVLSGAWRRGERGCIGRGMDASILGMSRPIVDPAGGVPVADAALVTGDSPAVAKIALFRSLFRGRNDVYPQRFESRRTGRAGYQPACANEWVRGICEKPRVKCADCPQRSFLPLSDEVVRRHLSGRDEDGGEFVIGIYPMLLDESCRVGRLLMQTFGGDKLNLGALGNLVPQLHVHLVVRRLDDPAWPGPVWGHSPAVPYPAPSAAQRVQLLRVGLGLPV